MKHYEDIQMFLDVEITNLHLNIIVSDVEQILELDNNVNPHHMDVVKSAMEIIAHKSLVANAILVEILKTEKMHAFDDALPIIRAKCIQYGPWKSIYPAIRDVLLGFEQHIKASAEINSHHDGLAHTIPYNFIPFVLPEMLTKLKGMTLSQAQHLVKPVPANICIDLKQQYYHIVEGCGQILAEITGTSNKAVKDSKLSNRIKKAFHIITSTNSKNKAIREATIAIRFNTPEIPGVERTASTSKGFKDKKSANKKTGISKPAASTIETNANHIISHFKFEKIETEIIAAYNQMMNKISTDDEEPSESKLTFDERVDIQNKLDIFTDDVNKIGTKWMKKLYDYIMDDINNRKR